MRISDVGSATHLIMMAISFGTALFLLLWNFAAALSFFFSKKLVSDLACHNLEKTLGPYPFPPIPFGLHSGIRTMPKIWWMLFLFILTSGRMVVVIFF